MNISNLERYLENKNKWAEVFDRRKMSLLNAKDRQALAEMLDGDLSPENLTCDGEADPAFVRKHHAYLLRVAQELKSIDPSVRIYELA
jgi:hypothetical protein